MSKNMIYGAGVLGIIAAVVYIYKEHKKAKDNEAESVVNVDSEETEETTKEQKKEVITEKVTSLGRKIGKSVGTFCLKFGAKHPKITKFILKFGCYIPYALIGIVSLAAMLRMVNRHDDTIDGSDMIYKMEVNDERFDQPMNMETRGVDPQKALEVWENSDLSTNYQKLYEFLKTLNLVYSEQYIIDNKESFADEHPEYNVSNVKDDFIIRQKYTVQEVADRISQQQ